MKLLTSAAFCCLSLVFVVLLGCASQTPSHQYANLSQTWNFGKFDSAHEHADFKVYIENIPYNFSQAKYMSAVPASSSVENCGDGSDGKLAHLHDMDGDVAHKHATGVTWGYFFSLLNISIDDTCMRFDDGKEYCDNGSKVWRYFVNGTEIPSISGYEIHQSDRVLITYGASDEQAKSQFATVTSKASQKDAANICGGLPAGAAASGN